jgi:hypothetical protein
MDSSKEVTRNLIRMQRDNHHIIEERLATSGDENTDASNKLPHREKSCSPSIKKSSSKKKDIRTLAHNFQ